MRCKDHIKRCMMNVLCSVTQQRQCIAPACRCKICLHRIASDAYLRHRTHKAALGMYIHLQLTCPPACKVHSTELPATQVSAASQHLIPGFILYTLQNAMSKWQSSSNQLDMQRKYGNGNRAQGLRQSMRKPRHRKKIDPAMYDTKAMVTRLTALRRAMCAAEDVLLQHQRSHEGFQHTIKIINLPNCTSSPVRRRGMCAPSCCR